MPTVPMVASAQPVALWVGGRLGCRGGPCSCAGTDTKFPGRLEGGSWLGSRMGVTWRQRDVLTDWGLERRGAVVGKPGSCRQRWGGREGAYSPQKLRHSLGGCGLGAVQVCTGVSLTCPHLRGL